MRAEKDEVSRLAEYDVVNGALPFDVDECGARPPFEDASICLSKPPLRVPLNTQRLQHVGRKP